MADENISAKQVKELREKTGVGMMDCKQALAETGGDLDQAVKVLREKGLASVKKRQSKTADQGIVEAYMHIGKQIGALVEINCETDFVARNDEFLELAHEVALHIAALNPKYLDREAVPEDVIESEKAIYAKRCEAEGKPEKVRDRIIEGMLDKYYQEYCLLEQPFVRDASVTVGELVSSASAKLGEKLEVRRFARFQVGEKLE